MFKLYFNSYIYIYIYMYIYYTIYIYYTKGIRMSIYNYTGRLALP